MGELDDKLISEIRQRPHLLHELPARRFEELVVKLLEARGLKAEFTKASRDGGRDIVAVSKEPHSMLLVECKRYSKDQHVPLREVEALYGVLTQEAATKGMLVTTSSFTASAREFLKKHQRQLEGVDFDQLLEWLTLYEAARSASPSAKEPHKDNSRAAPALPLYFDLSEFSADDMREIISQLSSLYEDCGGEGLTIEDVHLLDPAEMLQPTGGD